jgi:TolB-like protein/Tfp pilus assembly protein PilF
MANPNKLSRFWQELKRRNVVRVVSVYAGAAFVILELVDILGPSLGLPPWTLNFVLILLTVGFFFTVIVSWIYDIHPEGGVIKTEPVEKIKAEEISKSSSSWKIASYISFAVIIGLITWNILRGNRGAIINESMAKSIAVLPFHNLSGDDEQEYICDGLTEEIIGHLFKVRSFDKIVSFSSVMNYKDPQRNIPKIAEELGVNYILEGSFKDMGGKLKITAQLIESSNDNYLWLEDFEPPNREVIGIPGEIALQIAGKLEAYISKSEKSYIKKSPTYNQEAWKKYQRARFFRDRADRSFEKLEKARDLLEEAITLDPNFALAYAALADTYLSLFWFKFDQTPLILAKCREAIDEAFRIEPNSPDAFIQLARYYYTAFLNYPKSLELLEKASTIMPEHPEIYFISALNYRRMGEWEKAIIQFEKARELDPRNITIIGNMLESYYMLKKYDKAEQYIDLTFEIDRGLFQTYEHQAMVYLLRDGDVKQAKVVFEEMKQRIGYQELINNSLVMSPIQIEIIEGNYQSVLDFIDSTDWSGMINSTNHYPNSLIQARLHKLQGSNQKAAIYFDSARMDIEGKLAIFPEDPVLTGALGICYAGLGEKDMAIKLGMNAILTYSLEKDAYFGLMRIEELAWIYVMVEEYDMALEQLEILLSNPGPYSVPFLKLDPKWKPLWNYPSFIRLTDKYS